MVLQASALTKAYQLKKKIKELFCKIQFKQSQQNKQAEEYRNNKYIYNTNLHAFFNVRLNPESY